MKRLIVNGDDFGASRGVNRGILEAHRNGILSSASLMVDAAGSEEAARLARAAAALGVGLHLDVDAIQDRWPAALRRQLARFDELMGRPPSHLDVHHNRHRDPRLLPYFLELSRESGLPLREHCGVHHFSQFHGRWGGETHPEQISVASLQRMLHSEIREGTTELSCHPGYVDLEHRTSYSIEREIELRTLCDPAIRETLAELSIELVSHRDLGDRRCRP